MAPLFYVLVPSTFGTVGLLWQKDTENDARVQRVLLPRDNEPAEATIHRSFAGAQALSCPQMAELGQRLASFLQGEDVAFPLDLVALDRCPRFQQGVLRAEHRIPRGRVSTYGRIVRHIGSPGAARAVGNALANNPFPLLIPCHRAVRANGELGGYRGGLKMKQALLQMEGVEVTPVGKVMTNEFYY